MSQNNCTQIPAQIEQETTLETLHASFQQLCFAYGSLPITTFHTEKFKWLAQDAVELADIAMAIHRKNNGEL